MNFNYSKLFTIELLHEYFLNGKCAGLEIVPTEECREICRKMNILLRGNENQFIAFTRENDVQEPFINTAPKKQYRKYYGRTVFRFYLKVKDPLFLNYTNIEYSLSDRTKFYFNNLSKNQLNGTLYLTAPVKDYAVGTTYIPGDLAKDPVNGNVFESITKNVSKRKNQLNDPLFWTPKGLLYLSKALEDFSAGAYYKQGNLVKKTGKDDVYEAVKNYTAKNPTDLDDESLWKPRGQGQLQYPTSDDTTAYWSGRDYIFNLAAPVTKADISVLAFNYDPLKPGYTEEALQPEKRNFTKAVSQVSINLSSLKPGMYAIKINKEIKIVYYDPMIGGGDTLGVIEIFNHLPGTDEYALMTDDEKLKTPRYTIQFSNRRVLWKYIRKDGNARSITDTGKTKYEFNLNGEDFVSAIPIPLTENPLKTLKLDFNKKHFALQPLPNPRIQNLRKFNQNEFDYFCSEVYLNY